MGLKCGINIKHINSIFVTYALAIAWHKLRIEKIWKKKKSK